MKRIINHKRVDITDDEWNLYQEICRSYDRPNFKGESLFVDLFESDENGIITFLKPPSKNFTSMEVFLFMMSIFCHQHLRVVYARSDEVLKEVDSVLIQAKAELGEIQKMKDELRQLIEANKTSREEKS